jgi:hypothetical protein
MGVLLMRAVDLELDEVFAEAGIDLEEAQRGRWGDRASHG